MDCSIDMLMGWITLRRYGYIAILLLLLMPLRGTSQNLDLSGWTIEGTQLRSGQDPYLQKLYWKINDSPMQQKLRQIKPFPVGVVYYQQRGDDFEAVIKELRTIKKLGFTALKQLKLDSPKNPVRFEEKVFHSAIDEGLSPWYYGKGGWEHLDQKLLDKLGIETAFTTENLPKIHLDSRLIAYQNSVWHKRVDKMSQKPEKPKGMGEPGRNNPWLPERLISPFSAWLKNEYRGLDSLKTAWNLGFTDIRDFTTFNEAASSLMGTGFDGYGNGKGPKVHDFRRYRDAMKFQSELTRSKLPTDDGSFLPMGCGRA